MAAPSRQPGSDHPLQVDDYISPLTVETYTQCRMRTLLDYYEHEAPWIASVLRVIETLAILCMTSGTVLASLNMEVAPRLREHIPQRLACMCACACTRACTRLGN